MLMAEIGPEATKNQRIERPADAPPLPEHEQSDVSVKGIAIFLGILAVFAVILHFGLAGLQLVFRKETRKQDRQHAGSVADPNLIAARPNFPEPRLQTAPREDLQTLRAREEAELNSYAWIDRTAGIVRLPISRAMDLLVQRGLPVRGSNDTPRHISNLELQRSRAERP